MMTKLEFAATYAALGGESFTANLTDCRDVEHVKMFYVYVGHGDCCDEQINYGWAD